MNLNEDKDATNSVICNACGRYLKVERGLLLEDAFEAKKDWGFFSRRDLERHRFVLCEHCYEQIINKFVIPVSVDAVKEVL